MRLLKRKTIFLGELLRTCATEVVMMVWIISDYVIIVYYINNLIKIYFLEQSE
jgi:hypothetical protein